MFSLLSDLCRPCRACRSAAVIFYPETARGSRHGKCREISGEILLFLFPRETKLESTQNLSRQISRHFSPDALQLQMLDVMALFTLQTFVPDLCVVICPSFAFSPSVSLTSSSGGQKINANFFAQSFSTTLRVMDVRAENRGRLHRKVRFPAAPVMGRNFLTPGHPGVRVRNVRGKSCPKSLCLCCFFFPEFKGASS